ncbi:MAG: hypothetical protein AB8H47_13625 [Bacteroidia bacterium]
MISTQLYSLIKKLEPETQADFKNWLVWRLGGKESFLLVLYEQLLIEPKWTLVWQAMFPQKALPLNASKQIPHILRKRASALKKLLKEYLAYQNMREDQYFLDLSFLRHLNEGKFNDDFMLYFRQIERTYDNRDRDYHEQMGMMLEAFHAHKFKLTNKRKGYRWQEMLDHFALAYRYRFLQMYLSTINNRRLPQEVIKPNDFELEGLKKDPLVQNSPSLKLLLDVCRLMDGEAIDHVVIIEDYKNNYHYFAEYMQQNLLICLENYLYRLSLNRGLEIDRHLRFDFYLWSSRKGLSIYDGQIAPFRFVGIVSAGINAEQLDQVKVFMDEFTSKLDLKVRDELVHLCKGMCLVEEEKFDELLHGFLNMQYKSPSHEISAKLIHAQARYEKGERWHLEVPLKSLLAFSERQSRLGVEFKKQTKLKIHLFQKLLTQFKTDKVLKLREDAAQIKSFSFRKWMLAKIELRLEGDEPLYID